MRTEEQIAKNRASSKKWRENNPEKARKTIAIYRKLNPWMSSFDHAKWRCENKRARNYNRYGGRGIKFLITLSEFVELWIRDGAENMKSPTIDRIDNNGHYEFNNCQFIERAENTSKMRRGK